MVKRYIWCGCDDVNGQPVYHRSMYNGHVRTMHEDANTGCPGSDVVKFTWEEMAGMQLKAAGKRYVAVLAAAVLTSV